MVQLLQKFCAQLLKLSLKASVFQNSYGIAAKSERRFEWILGKNAGPSDTYRLRSCIVQTNELSES